MPSILLIGDSIRLGYEATVRAELAGAAEILSPEENGGDSRRVLDRLATWLGSSTPDIVHLNCGLHDLRTTPETGQYQVPIEDYEANLRQIFQRLTGRVKTVIWATTTPVNQERHNTNKPFHRAEADVDRYNTVARRVADEFKLPTDDLNQVVAKAGRDALLTADGVHYTDAGKALLGQAVATFLRQYR